MIVESLLLMFLVFTSFSDRRKPMPLKMNTARTFDATVIVYHHDESGQSTKGTFGAKFKVVPFDKAKEEAEASLIDLILVSVKEDDLELTNEDGQRLVGDDLMHFIKNDPSISTAVMATYNESLTKKNLKRT